MFSGVSRRWVSRNRVRLFLQISFLVKNSERKFRLSETPPNESTAWAEDLHQLAQTVVVCMFIEVLSYDIRAAFGDAVDYCETLLFRYGIGWLGGEHFSGSET